MNYVEIQNELDTATTAAIHAKTEEERELLKGDVRYWENKKAEYMATHNVKGELLNA